jgi:hypothetical protein
MVMVVKDVRVEVHNLRRIVLHVNERRLTVPILLVATVRTAAVFQACLGASAAKVEVSAA